jgi:hypothetical protein
MTPMVLLNSNTNADYGVFLFVEPSLKEANAPTNFELQTGELMDFGVYHKKNDHAFLMKNFVHGFKCEEDTFKTGE